MSKKKKVKNSAHINKYSKEIGRFKGTPKHSKKVPN